MNERLFTDEERHDEPAPCATPEGERTDVVVVGAGPGGAVLAYLLARSGVDTVLVERHADLSREFRGFGYSPVVLDLFDQMGIAGEFLGLGGTKIRRGTVHAFGEEYLVADYSTLPAPYDFVYFMEQAPLLELLIERASRYDNFTYYGGTTVTDLLREDGRVTGVRVRSRARNAEVDLESRLVVAADGRYSTVRTLAGIDPGLLESDVEVVWFKLPASVVEQPAETRLDEHGLLAYFGLGDGDVQAGWLIPKGTYPALKHAGIESFREALVAVDPRLSDVLPRALPDFGSTTLLRVEPGIAGEWVRDGLVLVGDAAHVASPFGGQGIPAAVTDAVTLHPIVVDALDRCPGDGPLLEELLEPFETRRRSAVEETLSAQRREERATTWIVHNHARVPTPILRAATRVVLGLGGPLVRRANRRFTRTAASDAVTVASEHFRD
jgi:2-polyprenyl-6-methoxyphenol hydroxylase-like FAD-dependent oxidoreductase